ncbi:energy transducer TonB [Hymenobacter edaphi]|uniref:TonB C-terminal domain-containing protein n=1 Tax=Hymenobacter edaphi TaxID=2211146 RepID=A0A328BC86_9BACT|nr:energy transducer TonB [Hymenobacter edaphi]RAK64703.1 hypothetical protein DLM85_18660 [Hymenobacter edaphi]
MPPLPPRRNGLSTRQFAWIFGGLLALLTLFQLAQHRPQRFEPPPSGTVAEIGGDETTAHGQARRQDRSFAPEPDSNVPASVADTSAAKVYAYVDQMPQPPGGMDGLLQYIGKNVHYPAEALDSHVEGKVYVNFTVGPDGRVRDVRVAKGIGAGCDEEAARVIRQMPRWQPGRHNGQLVSVSYTIPVTFTITTPSFLRFLDKFFHA